MKHNKHITVRVPQDFRSRLDGIQAEMSKRLSGIEMEWSKVVRLALERGAETIEKELDIKRK